MTHQITPPTLAISTQEKQFPPEIHKWPGALKPSENVQFPAMKPTAATFDHNGTILNATGWIFVAHVGEAKDGVRPFAALMLFPGLAQPDIAVTKGALPEDLVGWYRVSFSTKVPTHAVHVGKSYLGATFSIQNFENFRRPDEMPEYAPLKYIKEIRRAPDFPDPNTTMFFAPMTALESSLNWAKDGENPLMVLVIRTDQVTDFGRLVFADIWSPETDAAVRRVALYVKTTRPSVDEPNNDHHAHYPIYEKFGKDDLSFGANATNLRQYQSKNLLLISEGYMFSHGTTTTCPLTRQQVLHVNVTGKCEFASKLPNSIRSNVKKTELEKCDPRRTIEAELVMILDVERSLTDSSSHFKPVTVNLYPLVFMSNVSETSPLVESAKRRVSVWEKDDEPLQTGDVALYALSYDYDKKPHVKVLRANELPIEYVLSATVQLTQFRSLTRRFTRLPECEWPSHTVQSEPVTVIDDDCSDDLAEVLNDGRHVDENFRQSIANAANNPTGLPILKTMITSCGEPDFDGTAENAAYLGQSPFVGVCFNEKKLRWMTFSSRESYVRKLQPMREESIDLSDAKRKPFVFLGRALYDSIFACNLFWGKVFRHRRSRDHDVHAPHRSQPAAEPLAEVSAHRLSRDGDHAHRRPQAAAVTEATDVASRNVQNQQQPAETAHSRAPAAPAVTPATAKAPSPVRVAKKLVQQTIVPTNVSSSHHTAKHNPAH